MSAETTLYMFIKNGVVSYVNGVNHTVNSVSLDSYRAFASTKLTLMENMIHQIHPGSSEAIFYSESIRLNREIRWIDLELDGYTIADFYKIVSEYTKNTELTRIINAHSHTGLYISPHIIARAGNELEIITRNHPFIFDDYLKYIIYDRNDIWVSNIDAVASQTPVFVVCGYSHLSDLLKKLEGCGYEVFAVKERSD